MIQFRTCFPFEIRTYGIAGLAAPAIAIAVTIHTKFSVITSFTVYTTIKSFSESSSVFVDTMITYFFRDGSTVFTNLYAYGFERSTGV